MTQSVLKLLERLSLSDVEVLLHLTLAESDAPSEADTLVLKLRC